MDKHLIYIFMDEQSMAARMSRVRGFKTMDQVEYMHMVTLSGLKVPDRKKEVYGGTNQGNVIGPVFMRPLAEGWTTTYAEKKLIFGKHRRAVGGTEPGTAGNEKPPSVNGGSSKDRTDDNIEPVFYRALPPSFFHCLFASLSVKTVIDTTAGDGSAALAAIRLKKSYVGFALTEATPCKQLVDTLSFTVRFAPAAIAPVRCVLQFSYLGQLGQVHTALLLEYLTLAVLDEFLDSKSPLFQAKLANLKKDADKKASKKTGDKGSTKDTEDASDVEKKKKPSSGKKRAPSTESDASASAISSAASMDTDKKKTAKKKRRPPPKKKVKSASESGAST